MKKMIITNAGAVTVDVEKQDVDYVRSKVESIRSVYLIEEPTQVVYKMGDTTQEIYAEANDLIIVFYRDEFPNHIVVAKSAQWVDNIRAYDAAEQKRKEEWAAKQKGTNENCEGSVPCDSAESI